MLVLIVRLLSVPLPKYAVYYVLDPLPPPPPPPALPPSHCFLLQPVSERVVLILLPFRRGATAAYLTLPAHLPYRLRRHTRRICYIYYTRLRYVDTFGLFNVHTFVRIECSINRMFRKRHSQRILRFSD